MCGHKCLDVAASGGVVHSIAITQFACQRSRCMSLSFNYYVIVLQSNSCNDTKEPWRPLSTAG